MLNVMLRGPSDMRLLIAGRARERRLFLNLTQQELASRSGVSLGSIRRFEKSGLISLSSLLEIALVLNCLDCFDALFPPAVLETSLYRLPKKRQRGSRAPARN